MCEVKMCFRCIVPGFVGLSVFLIVYRAQFILYNNSCSRSSWIVRRNGNIRRDLIFCYTLEIISCLSTVIVSNPRQELVIFQFTDHLLSKKSLRKHYFQHTQHFEPNNALAT